MIKRTANDFDYSIEENVKYNFKMHTKERFHEQDPDKFVVDGFTYKLSFFEEFNGEIPMKRAIAMVGLQQLLFEQVKKEEPMEAIQLAIEYLIYNFGEYKKNNFDINQWKYSLKVATEDMRLATQRLTKKGDI